MSDYYEKLAHEIEVLELRVSQLKEINDTLRAECRAHKSNADRNYAKAIEKHAEVERLKRELENLQPVCVGH